MIGNCTCTLNTLSSSCIGPLFPQCFTFNLSIINETHIANALSHLINMQTWWIGIISCFFTMIAFYFIVYLFVVNTLHVSTQWHNFFCSLSYFLCFHCKPSIDTGANSSKAYLSNYICTNLSLISCFFKKGITGKTFIDID